MRGKGLLEEAQRVIQEIGGAGHRDLKLFQSFGPAALPMKNLKFAVLIIEDGLLGIEHQTIDSIHEGLQWQRQ